MPRADQLIVSGGHAPTRSAAHRLVDASAVQWLGPKGWTTLRKAGEDLPEGTQFRVTNDDELRWVSRAGLKLEGALSQIELDVTGMRCLDVGQSTGGFTDVLLTQGAVQVVGVDVGHSQLHDKLKADERVVALENVNARELDGSPLSEHAPEGGFDLIVADLSFIALSKVVPHLGPWLKPGGQVLMHQGFGQKGLSPDQPDASGVNGNAQHIDTGQLSRAQKPKKRQENHMGHASNGRHHRHGPNEQFALGIHQTRRPTQ
jgi:23S rRNA (cytidine1920-2'-O)/16S rRNA (cytidine1409-2'-O)-methyltransferase